jgi:hypothetical protein
MIQDFELLVAIAEIAGIFIGFGALISITRLDEIEAFQLERIRGVVTIGLVIVVVALIPVGLSFYGITGHTLWFTCSLIYFLMNWTVIIFGFRKAENRELLITQLRTSPFTTIFFWLLLEIPLQVPLVLTMLGWYPNLELAFYTTALLFQLFEAVFVLAQIVYSQVGPSDSNTSSHPSKSKKRPIIH